MPRILFSNLESHIKTAALGMLAFLAACGGNKSPVDFSAREVALDYRPSRVAAADFDLDGDADVAVLSQTGNVVTILANEGFFGDSAEPELSVPFFLDTGNRPMNLHLADIDYDGDVDILTANWDSRDISVLINRSSGGSFEFDPPRHFDAGASALAIATGDFDADGRVDVAVTTPLADKVAILYNKSGYYGKTAFGDPVKVPCPSHPAGIVADDFDTDGLVDLAVANYYSSNLSILPGKSKDGGIDPGKPFGEPVTVMAGPFQYPARLWAEDWDADGDTDIVAANPYWRENVAVFLNGGGAQGGRAGAFLSPELYPAGDFPFDAAPADFNADGLPELAVASREANKRVFLNLRVPEPVGEGEKPQKPHRIKAGQRPSALCAADFDGDSDLDLAIVDESEGFLLFFLNDHIQ